MRTIAEYEKAIASHEDGGVIHTSHRFHQRIK
jgi:hypothetical protein